MSRSWEDVRALLDDPHVDADTKEHLLAAYLQENDLAFGSTPLVDEMPDDVREYYDKYKIRGGDYDQGSLDEVYGRAEEEQGRSGYRDRLAREEIDANTSMLDGLRAPQEGQSGGVESSDEIFELARPALEVFKNFIPVNDKVPDDSLGDFDRFTWEDVTTRYEEQLGISFAKFVDDASRLRAAHQKLSELNSTTESELNSLYRSWTGDAANASYQHYSEKIGPNASDLLDYLSESPGMIETLVQNVFAECKAKADTVMGLYQPTVGSATPEIAMKVVELANSADDRDKILEVASWVDAECGSDIENTIRDDNCDLNDENKEYVQNECKKWIRESFNQELHEYLYATFDQTCKDTVEAIDSYYEELNSYLGEYENEFTDASQAPPPGTGTPPPGTTTPPPSGGSATPPPAGGSGSGGGSTTPSGSAPPVSTPPPTGSGGGGGSMPESPAAQTPQVPTPGTTSPAGDPSGTGDPTGTGSGGPGSGGPGSGGPGSGGPGSGGLGSGGLGSGGSGVGGPGTGGEDPTGQDPTGQDPTGQDPTGQDPTGQDPTGSGDVPPGTTPTTPGQEETVTIDDGERSISVTSPDGQGQVKVTVDDGSGEPKTYNLDFGEGGTQGGSPAAGTGGGDPQAFGPQGSQAPADQPIQPGEDGRCVIQDGDLTITAERPEGSADTVTVTVDDGTGEPTTYNLDYSGDGGPTATPDQPGQQPGRPSEAQAMYGRLNDEVDGAIEAPDTQQQPSGQYAPAGAGAEPAIDPGAPSPLDRDPAGQYAEPSYAATSAQASLPTDGGGGGGFFSQPDSGGASHIGAFGIPDQGQYTANSPSDSGEPGLASAGEGENGGRHSGGQEQSGQQQSGGGMAGMPMMGGLGTGGSGDQDRATGAQWRTTGDLFDDDVDTELRGAFGEGR